MSTIKILWKKSKRKGQLVLVITFVLMVCLIGGCGEVKVYTETEEMISTKVNHEFIVATSSNPATGYMWREGYHDKSMVELVVCTFEVSEAVKQGKAKIGLEQHFRFKALKKGKTEIAIEEQSPSLVTIRQKVFEVNIE